MSLHVAGVDDFRGFIRDLPERGHALASGKNSSCGKARVWCRTPVSGNKNCRAEP
jgi:hypothetical protein